MKKNSKPVIRFGKWKLSLPRTLKLTVILVLLLNSNVKAGNLPAKMLLQKQKITGKVTDSVNNESIPGVNVVVEGANVGTITNVDGEYSIEVPASSSVLTFSFIGYSTTKVQLTGQTIINVSLNPEIEKITEVVVFGYGTQKKETMSGSVANISGRDLVKSPTSNVSNSLEGRMPGLIINHYKQYNMRV